ALSLPATTWMSSENECGQGGGGLLPLLARLGPFATIGGTADIGLERSRLGNMLSNDFDHAVGRRAGRKEANVFAAFIYQLDERRMVDDVLRATGRVFCIINLVRERDASDLLRAAS